MTPASASSPTLPASSDAESAAYLQQRLAVFARLMFLAFVLLRLGEIVLYHTYPAIEPREIVVIRLIGGASLLLLGGAWLVLVRATLSPRTLHAIDVALMAGCGGVFGATAMLAAEREESAYTCLVYASFVVFMRTIVVPSSRRRTIVVATIAFVPLVIAALYLALESDQDVPGRAFFCGGLMYAGVGVAVAATGSHVIYGLRRRVSRLAREELELGQYRLVRKLGEGTSAEVFVARHALLRRPTAVKLVHPTKIGSDLLARREHAVQQMSQLMHHNTVAVYDYGRTPDGVFYFAMEYLEGITLDALRERYGTQPRARVIAILVQLCGALHEAHLRGFAHGNVSLRNVILCERAGLCDVVKLTDFGFGNSAATPASDLHELRLLADSLLGTDDSTLAACFDAAPSAKQLAVALRALPGAWTQAQARAWWAEYRRTSAPFLPVVTTLPVDLAHRTTPERLSP